MFHASRITGLSIAWIPQEPWPTNEFIGWHKKRAEARLQGAQGTRFSAFCVADADFQSAALMANTPN